MNEELKLPTYVREAIKRTVSPLQAYLCNTKDASFVVVVPSGEGEAGLHRQLEEDGLVLRRLPNGQQDFERIPRGIYRLDLERQGK